jgi:hypothetical protein
VASTTSDAARSPAAGSCARAGGNRGAIEREHLGHGDPALALDLAIELDEGSPRRRASALPSVVFPAPRRPISAMRAGADAPAPAEGARSSSVRSSSACAAGGSVRSARISACRSLPGSAVSSISACALVPSADASCSRTCSEMFAVPASRRAR